MLQRPARSARATALLTRRDRSAACPAAGRRARPRRRRDGRGERPAVRAAGEVGVEERGVDAGVLAVERRPRSPRASARTPCHDDRSLRPAPRVPALARGPRGRAIMSAVASDDPLLPYVEAALEGDDVAVGELVRLTQPAVWQVCRALGSPGEVEDLVQETYLRALGSLSRLPRRRAGAGVAAGDRPAGVRRPRAAPPTPAPADRPAGRPRRLDRVPAPEIVDDLLDGLDPDRREAFVLTQLVGLSYEEAAGVRRLPDRHDPLPGRPGPRRPARRRRQRRRRLSPDSGSASGASVSHAAAHEDHGAGDDRERRR